MQSHQVLELQHCQSQLKHYQHQNKIKLPLSVQLLTLERHARLKSLYLMMYYHSFKTWIIKLFWLKSTLLKIIPVFGTAGLMDKLTSSPNVDLCLKFDYVFNCFWFNTDTHNFYWIDA